MLLILHFSILLNAASGIDLNSLIPRENCYPTEQKGCENRKNFLDAHPDLAWSATNLTKANTYFWLFTRRNEYKPELLHECGGELPPNSNFNPNNRLIVILHPFIVGFCDTAIYREWLTQYLIRGDYNVLVVDHSWGIHLDYGTAILNTDIAAKQTIIVLSNILRQTEFQRKNIYIIGHSLGAHMAGKIGHEFHVGRITGIDPAGPGFDQNTPNKNKLDKGDADLVDVWHANMGCLPNLGQNYDVGHVNFYINDANEQPACHEYALTSLLKRDYIYGIGTAAISTTCSHAFAAVYYKVTINPGDCQFVGIMCDSYDDFENNLCNSCGENGEKCTIMGFDLDQIYTKTDEMRKYYVRTTLDCPYCDNSDIELEGFSTTYNSLLQKPGSELI